MPTSSIILSKLPTVAHNYQLKRPAPQPPHIYTLPPRQFMWHLGGSGEAGSGGTLFSIILLFHQFLYPELELFSIMEDPLQKLSNQYRTLYYAIQLKVTDTAQVLRTNGSKLTENEIKTFTNQQLNIFSMTQKMFNEVGATHMYQLLKAMNANLGSLVVLLLERVQKLNQKMLMTQKQAAEQSENQNSKHEAEQGAEKENIFVQVKRNKLGGVQLFNENYARYLEDHRILDQIKFEKEQRIDKKKNELLSSMIYNELNHKTDVEGDPTSNDDIAKYIIESRNKGSIFNYVPYQEELQEILTFFQNSQSEANNFLIKRGNADIHDVGGKFSFADFQRDIQYRNREFQKKVMEKLIKALQKMRQKQKIMEQRDKADRQQYLQLMQVKKTEFDEKEIQTQFEFDYFIKQCENERRDIQFKCEALESHKVEEIKYIQKENQLANEITFKSLQIQKLEGQVKGLEVIIMGLKKMIRQDRGKKHVPIKEENIDKSELGENREKSESKKQKESVISQSQLGVEEYLSINSNNKLRKTSHKSYVWNRKISNDGTSLMGFNQSEKQAYERDEFARTQSRKFKYNVQSEKTQSKIGLGQQDIQAQKPKGTFKFNRQIKSKESSIQAQLKEASHTQNREEFYISSSNVSQKIIITVDSQDNLVLKSSNLKLQNDPLHTNLTSLSNIQKDEQKVREKSGQNKKAALNMKKDSKQVKENVKELKENLKDAKDNIRQSKEYSKQYKQYKQVIKQTKETPKQIKENPKQTKENVKQLKETISKQPKESIRQVKESIKQGKQVKLSNQAFVKKHAQLKQKQDSLKKTTITSKLKPPVKFNEPILNKKINSPKRLQREPKELPSQQIKEAKEVKHSKPQSQMFQSKEHFYNMFEVVQEEGQEEKQSIRNTQRGSFIDLSQVSNKLDHDSIQKLTRELRQLRTEKNYFTQQLYNITIEPVKQTETVKQIDKISLLPSFNKNITNYSYSTLNTPAEKSERLVALKSLRNQSQLGDIHENQIGINNVLQVFDKFQKVHKANGDSNSLQKLKTWKKKVENTYKNNLMSMVDIQNIAQVLSISASRSNNIISSKNCSPPGLTTLDSSPAALNSIDCIQRKSLADLQQEPLVARYEGNTKHSRHNSLNDQFNQKIGKHIENELKLQQIIAFQALHQDFPTKFEKLHTHCQEGMICSHITKYFQILMKHIEEQRQKHKNLLALHVQNIGQKMPNENEKEGKKMLRMYQSTLLQSKQNIKKSELQNRYQGKSVQKMKKNKNVMLPNINQARSSLCSPNK